MHILYCVAQMPMLYVPAMLFMISFLYMDKVGKYKVDPMSSHLDIVYNVCPDSDNLKYASEAKLRTSMLNGISNMLQKESM